ncbi:MAG: hypothetical protein ACPLQS_05125 [Desulfurococcaceae archaeon]
MSHERAWEGLSILVDGVVVKSVLVASFREGVLAHWPPLVDEEMLSISNELYIPSRGPGYSVIEYLGSSHKYIVIVLGEKVVVFQVDKRVQGEFMGKKLLEVFSGAYLGLNVKKGKLVQEEV